MNNRPDFLCLMSPLPSHCWRCTVRHLSGGAAWPWQVRGGGRRQVRRRNPAVCSRWRLPTSRRRETITRPALCLANPRKSSRILRRPPAQCTTPTKFRPSVRLLHVHATSWGRVAQLHPLHPLHTTVRPPVERSSGQRAAGSGQSRQLPHGYSWRSRHGPIAPPC